MSVDQDTVRKIARLARLRVSDENVPRLEGELNQILEWIEQLNEVETEGVEPMTSVVETSMTMRDDVVDKGGVPDLVLANAPEGEDNFFMVPKVVE